MAPFVSIKSAAAATFGFPSWTAKISNATLRADMIAACGDGAIDSSDLRKLLGDVSVFLKSSTLSTAMFADLKTIAANLNVGVATNVSLTYAFSALVNGNASNAYWTGGRSTRVALGNLSVGSGATKFNNLVRKWMEGGDLPSSVAKINGLGTLNVTYYASTAPLFATGGPSCNDVAQGNLGDCYMMATAGALANQNAAAIVNMFTDNGNGTYNVRFFVGGKAQYVTINGSLANVGNNTAVTGDVWVGLLEKAWAQFQEQKLMTGNSAASFGNSFATIGNGGRPDVAMFALGGASRVTILRGSATTGTWTQITESSALAITGSKTGLAGASVLEAIATALANHDGVTLSSMTNASDASGARTLVAGHQFTVIGVDVAAGTVTLRNPWGERVGQTWRTSFDVPIATLMRANDSVFIDNSGEINTLFTTGTESVALSISDRTWRALAGDDVVTGTQGVDAIYGDEGNDALKGMGGADLLNGGDGDDRFDGGFGDDTLYGGAGADAFAFTMGEEGTDEIMDWDGFDAITLIGFGYASAADVASHMSQVGSDAVFSDKGQTIVVHNAIVSNLTFQLG